MSYGRMHNYIIILLLFTQIIYNVRYITNCLTVNCIGGINYIVLLKAIYM